MSHYPFAAIVGQSKLKRALLLCAVNPSIGGVLIKGEKGTAKSTAARGLAAVMPQIQRITDSVFNTSEQEYTSAKNEEDINQYHIEDINVPFVDLPLGASEDRVMGSLDLQAIVSEKKKKFLPGLLAGAHRGILYIDEVNLLPDHLVDILLDVAASGVNTVQREGLSVSHPSRFVLIGTMNPEEGNLRPQFLDRFGLMVEVEDQLDLTERTEVVRRRMAFEHNAGIFQTKWSISQQLLREQILTAQRLLPSVTVPDGLLTLISQLCIEWSVASLRADIVLYKTAVTLAAMAGRIAVNSEDIRQAAELVLVHRKGKRPFEQNKNTTREENSKLETREPSELKENKAPVDHDEEDAFGKVENECGDENCPPATGNEIFAIGKAVEVPAIKSELRVEAPRLMNGRRSKAANTTKGFQVRAERNDSATDVAISETIQHAIFRDPDLIELRGEDLHHKVRNGKAGHLILFVVDASGSMAAGKRMQAVKGSVLSLLKDAYQKRDLVGVISFRGVEAEVLLEPTANLELAETALQSLPTGGRTPLAHAMQLAQEVLDQYKTEKNIQPLLIVLSDGKANVPLSGGGDPWQQTLQTAISIAHRNVLTLVLDTENSYLRFGKAAELAEALRAECLSLDDLTAETITQTVSGKIDSLIKI